MIYTHKKQITRPGSLFKWEAWRILQRCFIIISCHCVILFHNLFFNPAVIVLHEVDALNRCSQSLAIYSITSIFLNFGLCYYVTNISGIELYDIFKIP